MVPLDEETDSRATGAQAEPQQSPPDVGVGADVDVTDDVSDDRGTTDSMTVLALDGQTVVGRADRAGETVTVTVYRRAPPEVGAELVRQLVARGVDEGRSRIQIAVPTRVRQALANDLVAGVDSDALDGERVLLEIDLDAPAAARTVGTPGDTSDVAVPIDLDGLFAPDRVAVVGATDRDGSIGRTVVANLTDGYDGEVVPVTQSTARVLGLQAVDDVADADADLAVVVLPADAAVTAVEDAAAAGVDAIAVLSAGFAETGTDDGRRRQQRLETIASEHDVALVGPNALGVLSTRRDMNASFSPERPPAGGVSILSHSGAMVTATLDWAIEAGVGVRDVVSLGNAAGIDEADCLRYWGADDGTEVVFAYLEDVQDGERFVEAAREVSRTTPIVVLKAGRSRAGGAAAASHTGALVGDHAGFQAAFDESGVIEAPSQQAAYDLLALLRRQPVPTGDRVAVVTNAGGPGVLATDAIAESGVELASLGAATQSVLEERLPGPASARNPVDVLGDAGVDRFVDALETVLGDDGVDAALVVSTPHPLVDQASLVDRIGDVGRRYGKPVLTCLSGGQLDTETRQALASAGVPNYRDAVRATQALSAYVDYGAWRRRGVSSPEPVAAARDRVGGVIAEALAEDRPTLGVDAMDVLEAYGISIPNGRFVDIGQSTTETGVDEAAVDDDGSELDEGAVAVETSGLDGPFAVKVASPDLVHKSDVGGVRVDVPEGGVEDAVGDVVRAVRSNAPDARISGVRVEELAADGVECVVGVTRHPRFGPMVTVGLGGVLVEHLEDVAHALAPVSRERARRLLTSLEGASILDGARGADAVDVDALADAVVRLSWLAVDHDAIAELEVNPLVATPDGTVAVDFHAQLEADGAGTAGGGVDAAGTVDAARTAGSAGTADAARTAGSAGTADAAGDGDVRRTADGGDGEQDSSTE